MTRYIIVLVLALTLSGCAGLNSVLKSSIQPSEKWYIAMDGESKFAYYEPKQTFDFITLDIYERYQIIGIEQKFYKIRTITGDEYYLFTKDSAPVIYTPGVHPSIQELNKIDRECTTCRDYSSQAAAQAAFNADRILLSALDADGDGTVCEYISDWDRSSSSVYSSDSYRGERSGDVHVKGHYRTTKNGKRVYVRPHTRSRPKRD